MRRTQWRAGLALGLALLVVAVVVTACGAPSAFQPTPAAQATSAPATQGAATQAAPQATSATGPSAPLATANPGSQDVGASANLSPAAKFTTHWKGDPNAKVVIIEVSDFQ